MDTPDAAVDPKGIELTAPTGPTKSERARVQVEVTFRTHVGWDGALWMLFSLGVAGLFLYITSEYTRSFRTFHRPWVWVFVVFAVFYTLLFVKFLLVWKKLATTFTVEQQKQLQQEKEGIKEAGTESARPRSRSALKTAKLVTVNVKTVYQNLQVSGQWFLWKMYASELLESVVQTVNLVTVYLCSLPVEWTVWICFGISAYCAHTVLTVLQKNTPTRRDRQVKLDVIADFLCVAVPLCALFFAFHIPLSVPELLSITILPTFSILLKLDDILEEVIKHRSAVHVLREQSLRSFDARRRRQSLFQQVLSEQIAEEQEDKVPWRVRVALAATICGFGLFFFVVAVAHLVMHPSGCNEITWENGCKNKIPFCKSLFTPTCNCASLEIKNDYKLVALPNSLVDTMTGLRKVLIQNCNLTVLPSRMEQLTEMVQFELSLNKLQLFDVDVRKWAKLNKLSLDYNNITRYHEQSMWTHPNVAMIDLLGNKLTHIPFPVLYLPSLFFLQIGENGIDIDFPFSRKQFPSLMTLFANGNNILQFPDESLGSTLIKLGIARCNLKALPVYLTRFNSLRYFDARDNNITFVDKTIKSLIKKHQMESYFSGNPVCKTDNSLDCEPLFSKHCWRRIHKNDGTCDLTCNTKQCQFDGGDCEG